MSPQPVALAIARLILAGFDDYRRHFKRLTDGARARFEQARWQAIQHASAQRIELYELKVNATLARLHERFAGPGWPGISAWPLVKTLFISLIVRRRDAELAETWFNSVFCGLFSHELISDGCMFIHSTRPPLRRTGRLAQVRRYRPNADWHGWLGRLFADYRFAVPYAHLEADLQRLLATLQHHLPSWVLCDPALRVELFGCVFYRNKGAYLVGRLLSGDEQWPLAIALLNPDGQGIVIDALILDEAEVSIIFSFTRSYFMVEVQVPRQFVAFLQCILPGKQLAELYSSIGFYRQGKSEFYRALIGHLNGRNDRFVLAAGVPGMVMSVFTLPGFNTVFKIIRDRFAPAKQVNRATVIDRYHLVKNIDRVGRLADTQAFADFRFPLTCFEPACLTALLQSAPATVSVQGGETVRIRHCWTERRMTPLNLYLEQASATQQREVLDDYGLAIRQLAAANIFPGDMLTKNFGVTRHGRVVFYDYDEICLLTEVNFRRIPPPRTPEDEWAAEPWYAVAAHDVFPEEFPTFLFPDPALRRLFTSMHGELFDAAWWQGVQADIRAGQVLDVFPYRRGQARLT